MTPTTAPYGSWHSPISADLMAGSVVSLSRLQVDGGRLFWVEGRPLEAGRNVPIERLDDGRFRERIPGDHNSRTLVHEYGGKMDIVVGNNYIYANFIDQRLYLVEDDQTAQAITPEPPQERSIRYADGRLTPDGKGIVCARETHHEDGSVVNDIALVLLEGDARQITLVEGCDFYSNPRFSPDGAQLAYLCWNNPQMPWDGTELWLADFDPVEGLSNQRRIAGGESESIFQPEWSPEGVLTFVSDRTGWWNLYQIEDGQVRAIAPMAAEFGQPQWLFGFVRYLFLEDGKIAAIYSQDSLDYLAVIDPKTATINTLECPFTTLTDIATDGSDLYLIGANSTTGLLIFKLTLSSSEIEVIKRSSDIELDPSTFSVAEPIAFPTEEGLDAYAIFYPPHNPAFVGPAGEQPPLIVISHGGPTSASKARLYLGIQYWTSRGFGVVDVNYGGSTGYGRAYRERLKGNWGIVDVMDCINAARYLVSQGRADGERVIVRGGSAGGYTTLRALTWKDYFAAGASYFGLAELEAFVEDTHKFEARYLDSLIGPYPEAKETYYNRSPVNFVDDINCPMILLQGLEDKIVPPSQAEIMLEALRKNGLPHAYVPFEGEQHGFRKAASIIRAIEAEYYFYSRVFGFDLSEDIEPVDIIGLTE
ncbi:MAG: S9 family peptidase [Chloroflexi bacterium]|nr:S9 family peptidase [Chloroflexota bacterium]